MDRRFYGLQHQAEDYSAEAAVDSQQDDLQNESSEYAFATCVLSTAQLCDKAGPMLKQHLD